MHRLHGRRRGTTLAELLAVVVVVGALTAIALPRLHEASDRFSCRGAIQEGISLFSFARRSAIARRAPVAVVIDTVRGAMIVRIGPSELARVGLRERYGVRLRVTRDSMTYDPRGLGYGAANLTVIARRGRVAETLSVSRLGRTRR
jgi:hypothetical protein